MAVTDNIALLKNLIQQKFVKISKRARIKEEDGKSPDSEFCCLMRLHSLYIAICDTPSPTHDQLVEFEVLANSICGRDRFIFKPMDWCALDFENAGPNPDVPVSACEISYSNPAFPGDNTLCEVLDKVVDQLNYEHPWIQFTIKSGLAAGKYEVGTGGGIATVGVTVNKSALNFYDIDRNGDLIQYARELKNAIPDQVLNIQLGTALPVQYLLHGEYFDLQRYLNQNLKAETSLKWETVWPIYYGVGPVTALDDLNGANAFIRSLTRVLDFTKCHEIDVTEGNVLWYFYPHEGVNKHFVTENGVMMGSYKGELQNFRTQSMEDFAIAGGKTYGVIRTDQPGIRYLRFCVEVMLIGTPILPITPPIDNDVTVYDSSWSNLQCVKIEDTV